MRKAITAKAWMELYGTPDAPGPELTGWKGFSHPTRKQWAGLRTAYNAKMAAPILSPEEQGFEAAALMNADQNYE